MLKTISSLSFLLDTVKLKSLALNWLEMCFWFTFEIYFYYIFVLKSIQFYEICEFKYQQDITSRTRNSVLMQVMFNLYGSILVAFGSVIVSFIVVIFSYFQWNSRFWNGKNIPYVEPYFPFGRKRRIEKATSIADDVSNVVNEARKNGLFSKNV